MRKAPISPISFKTLQSNSFEKKNFRQTKQMPTERDHLFHSSKIHRPMSKTE